MSELVEKTYRQYLVLGIAVQKLDPDPNLSTIEFGNTISLSGARYSLRRVKEEGITRKIGRYFWVIHPGDLAPLREAHHLAQGIATLSIIIPFCLAQSVDDLLHIMPLPEDVSSDPMRNVVPDELAELLAEEMFDLFGDEDMFHMAFGSSKLESIDSAERMVPYLRRYASDEVFSRCCSYLGLSMSLLGIDVCDWADQDYDQSFFRYVSVSRAESAFLNAFKAIEAIVGEPSKNRTREKIINRLRQQGLDPLEQVGYRNRKMNIIDRILAYHKVRDQVAAHGIGRLKRDLQLSEIIELQALARHLLLSFIST